MAGEWDVVEEKPVSEWDVVSTEPVATVKRTGAAAVPTADEAAGRGYQAPAPRREPDILEKTQGAVAAALNTVAGLFGGGAGMAYGALEALGENVGSRLAGQKPRMDVEKQMGLRAHQLTPTLPAIARTPLAEEYTGNVGQVMAEHGPALMGIGPELAMLGKAMQPAKRAIGDSVRADAGRVVDSVTPSMTPERAALAQKAVSEGIPLNLHQLSDNKLLRMAGEASESLPLAGSKRAQRIEKFNEGLVKMIDPDSTHTKLTPDNFAEVQDKAGQTIGDISARTPVPKESLGDLTAVARRETPDVQQVIKTYAEDFAKVADENGGVIPGDTLRRLRTEAQSQARTTSNGDLRRTLGDFIKKVDDALTEHAADGDMEALLDARRRYAISKTLEPLVAKSPDGNISPAALMGRATADNAGKRRMARGKGGDLGDYARIGQQFLKDQASSGTAERHLVIRALTGAGKAAAEVAGGAIPANIYNRFGPRVAKWLVERDARKRTAEPPPAEAAPPPEPTLGQGFEDVPPRGGGGPASPLGDLVPDWEVVPGAAPERPPAMSPEGLVQAVDDPAVTTGRRKDLRAGLDIPAVEGRPDLPDALVTGAPAESAATPRANEAMVEPGAIEARRRQGQAEVDAAAAREAAEPVPVGEVTEIKPEVVTPASAPKDPRLAEIARLKAATKSDVVRKALDRRAAAVKREIDAAQAADDLRAAAEQTKDPEIKKALLAEADKASKPEPIPVGEATEIKPEVIEPGVPREDTQSTPAASGKADEAPVQQAGPDSPAAPAANRAQADEGRPGAGEGEVDGGRLRADDLQPETRQEGVQADGGTGAQAGKAAGEEGQTHLTVDDLPAIDENFMREQQRVQEAARPAPMSDRGLAAVRKTLMDGAADGSLDKDGVALALWALERNPNLAKGLKQEGLKLEVRRAVDEAPGARGAYSDARELVKLVAGNTDPLTAAHEILHHAERMMPPKMQAGIRREWRRAVQAEIRNTSPLNPERADALKLALRAMEDGDASAYNDMKPYFKSKVLTRDDYRLVNPTEWWAENASEVLHGRFSGRGSWRAEAVRWLSELVEHLKATVGLRSDAPILKALDEILNPAKTTGERKSKNMITGSGRRDQPAQPQAP